MAKAKKDIAKIIVKSILIGGAIAVASTSPNFARTLVPSLIKTIKYKRKIKKKEDELDRIYNSFYYLKRKGLLKMEYRRKQLYISLSEEGRKYARKYSIDELKIEKPKKWDKKWRILIFDIAEKKRIRRDALRGKLKELGLYQLQKSVWVCPYNFKKEVELLKRFFGLTKEEMTTFIATEIENEKDLITFFNLNS